jgi:hypothetical protein
MLAIRLHAGCLFSGPAAAILILLFTLGTASADVRIQGAFHAIRVEARDATVAEVLAALGETFDFEYLETPGLDRPINGAFEGTLVQVLTRVLERYDYVVKSSRDGDIEVIHVGARASNSSLPGSAKPPRVDRPATARHPVRSPAPSQDSRSIELTPRRVRQAETLNRLLDRCRTPSPACSSLSR